MSTNNFRYGVIKSTGNQIELENRKRNLTTKREDRAPQPLKELKVKLFVPLNYVIKLSLKK